MKQSRRPQQPNDDMTVTYRVIAPDPNQTAAVMFIDGNNKQ